jgi:UDP-MurNAc hydroxylase
VEWENEAMNIRLVAHASVIISCADTKIWTDPWLGGKVFNDSWTLWPPAEFSLSLLEGVEYLWLSHEHPDHLNFANLASLPIEFKKHVTVLFQNNNPDRIFNALYKLGFQKFQVLMHRRIVRLRSHTHVYCYRVGTLDSCLGVMSNDQTVFNVNDARLNGVDHARIMKDISYSDVVLNQFSIAVKDSIVDYERHARTASKNIIESVSADHQGLNAKVTVPFASFMYFSSIDNAYMNAFINKPRDIFEFCKNRRQQVVVLYPGDEYAVNQVHDSSSALARYDEAHSKLNSVSFDCPPVVSLAQLVKAFHALMRNLRANYPQLILRRLRPLRVHIPDLDSTMEMVIANGSIVKVDENTPPDVIIYSQPLHYCLTKTWGMGTLTSSCRFVLLRKERNWKAHKALLALNNAEVCLQLRYLFQRRNWAYLRDRLNGMTRYTEQTTSHI